MINLQESSGLRGIKLTIPGSAIKLATDCATEPIPFWGSNLIKIGPVTNYGAFEFMFCLIWLIWSHTISIVDAGFMDSVHQSDAYRWGDIVPPK